MKISIIIPSLNEEKFLPNLLESIERQSFRDYEIIVADAGSRDATVKVAQDHGARVVQGGMPAVGRNAGGRIAQGDFLFFFDADVVLPQGFLENAYNEMQMRYLDFAACEVVPISELHVDKVLHGFANMSIKMGQYSYPFAPGFCILVSKRLFDRVGGFDETLSMAEDHEFAKRAVRFRPLRVLESTHIMVSVRRLEKEGRLALASKYIKVEIHRFFKGEVYNKIFEYEFGNYDQQNPEFEKGLDQFDKQLNRISTDFVNFTRRHSRNGHSRPPSLFDRLNRSLERAFTREKK